MGSPLWLLPVVASGGGSEGAGAGWHSGWHSGHLWLSWVGGHGPAAHPSSLWDFRMSASNPWGAAGDLHLIRAAI